MAYGLAPHVLEVILGVFQVFPGVQRVELYGSRAKGNFRPGSDIDLCITGETLTLQDLLAIEARLDELMLPYKIDLSLRHRIDSTALLEHIDRVGIPIYLQAVMSSHARIP